MKKYIHSILLFSMGGAVLSGIMLIQYYIPEWKPGFISWIDGIINSSGAVDTSDYRDFFGIPLASYRIFSFLFIVFTILIADYAGGRYPLFALSLLLPLAIITLSSDIILIIILTMGKVPCSLSIFTYAIDAILVMIFILWRRSIKMDENLSIKSIFKLLGTLGNENDRRASLSAYFLLIFFLAFAVFSTTHILKIKVEKAGSGALDIPAFMDNFRKSKAENINFPLSRLKKGAGNPAITMRVFTDFLCSACYKMHGIEKYLLEKFAGRLEIIYYNFPLDKSCNDSVETLYKNSCLASKVMISASESEVFEEYHKIHFDNYEKYKSGFNLEIAGNFFNSFLNNKATGKIIVKNLSDLINSQIVTDILNLHIKTGKSINIEATPTLFISGKRIVGIPPKELLEAIIKEELSKK